MSKAHKAKDYDLTHYLSLVFIQLFCHKQNVRQTKISFLKLLANDGKILYYLSQEDHAMFNKFAIFYQLIQENIEVNRLNQTLSILSKLFENEQLSDFEMAIILVIIYEKLIRISVDSEDDLIAEFIQTETMNAYLNRMWPLFTKFLDESTHYRFEIEIL